MGPEMPGRQWNPIEVFERIKGFFADISELVADANQKKPKEREIGLTKAANQAATETIAYLVGDGEVISCDQFILTSLTSKSEATGELTKQWTERLKGGEEASDKYVVDALFIVGPQVRDARQLLEQYLPQELTGPLKPPSTLRPLVDQAIGLRPFFENWVALDRRRVKLLEAMEGLRFLLSNASKPPAGLLRRGVDWAAPARDFIDCLVGQEDPVQIPAVKTGILGRSRSAVSGRNRFYQPSDAVRFRALNSLSPTTCGAISAYRPEPSIGQGIHSIRSRISAGSSVLAASAMLRTASPTLARGWMKSTPGKDSPRAMREVAMAKKSRSAVRRALPRVVARSSCSSSVAPSRPSSSAVTTSIPRRWSPARMRPSTHSSAYRRSGNYRLYVAGERRCRTRGGKVDFISSIMRSVSAQSARMASM
jgi:hypothetical protein